MVQEPKLYDHKKKEKKKNQSYTFRAAVMLDCVFGPVFVKWILNKNEFVKSLLKLNNLCLNIFILTINK